MPKRYKIFNSREQAKSVLPENSPKKLILNGEAFCLIRMDEEILATANMCPHSHASLSEGKLNSYNEIICPLHEYRFDLRSGRETNQRCDDLEIFKIEIEDNGVYLLR